MKPTSNSESRGANSSVPSATAGPVLLPLNPAADPAIMRDIALVATDVDGTLTRAGKLDPGAISAITELDAAGVRVLPVSGRPAGEVLGLCRYLPGVTRGLAENGLLEIVPDAAPRWLAQPTDRARLEAIGARLNAELGAKLRRTGDAFCRIGDVAYERDGRGVEELERLKAAVTSMGAFLVWSSVHVHIAEAIPDKGVAVLQLARELGVDRLRVATIGDAPNDAGLFVSGRFGVTVGTADVTEQRASFPALPQLVTAEREAGGFIELARSILRHRV